MSLSLRMRQELRRATHEMEPDRRKQQIQHDNDLPPAWLAALLLIGYGIVLGIMIAAIVRIAI